MTSSSARAWDTIDYLHLQYSAGLSVAQLAPFVPTVVDWWEEYAVYDKAYDDSPAANGRRVPHLDLYDKDFWRAIRLTSFTLLLGHSNLLPRVAKLWDYENDDMDGLLERLVAPFAPDRAPPPDKCTRHLPYFKLLKVFAADAAKRPAMLSRYMDEWYEASRRESYYGAHTKGREHGYLGHWSFEAAAVTYLLDIDDTSYRDKQFYPRDLIDYARSLPRPVELGGASSTRFVGTDMGLRVEAGNPCPRSGYWFTPAKTDSRRRFEAGEVMPAVGGDYGATIWQWDQRQD